MCACLQRCYARYCSACCNCKYTRLFSSELNAGHVLNGFRLSSTSELSGGCLENKKKTCQNCSLLYCVPQLCICMSIRAVVTSALGLVRLCLSFFSTHCVFFTSASLFSHRISVFCVLYIFTLVVANLVVKISAIDCLRGLKDLTLK